MQKSRDNACVVSTAPSYLFFILHEYFYNISKMETFNQIEKNNCKNLQTTYALSLRPSYRCFMLHKYFYNISKMETFNQIDYNLFYNFISKRGDNTCVVSTAFSFYITKKSPRVNIPAGFSIYLKVLLFISVKTFSLFERIHLIQVCRNMFRLRSLIRQN